MLCGVAVVSVSSIMEIVIFPVQFFSHKWICIPFSVMSNHLYNPSHCPPFWISVEPHPFFVLVSCQRWLLWLPNQFLTLFIPMGSLTVNLVEFMVTCFAILPICKLNVMIRHQNVYFYVTHHKSLLVIFPLSLPFHLPPSSSMKKQSWSNTWNKSRSSRLTSSWKRLRRWRMKPSQSS